MNITYEKSPQILDPNKINETISHLKEIFNKIKEKFQKIRSEHRISNYEKEVKTIKSLLNNILSLLKENPLFKDEFYDFYSIKLICDYILNDLNLFSDFQSFIIKLLRNFRKLILYKLEYEGEDYDYSRIYTSFKNYLDNEEETFYTKIYYYDGENKELIHEINNMIWGEEY